MTFLGKIHSKTQNGSPHTKTVKVREVRKVAIFGLEVTIFSRMV